jgi:hypothetical protein
MSRQVKILKAGVSLPDGNYYTTVGVTVTLTDAQFAKIQSAVISGGYIQDLGGTPDGGGTIGSVAGLQQALDGKSAFKVDGVLQPTFDLVTGTLAPSDLNPPSYSQLEIDARFVRWPKTKVGKTGSQDYLTTTYALISELTVPVVVSGTGDTFEVTLTLDIAAYAANSTSVFIAVLNSTASQITGASTSYPIRIPVANLRFPVTVTWTVSGMTAGSYDMRGAGYLTAAGNYQLSTGSTLSVQRIA